MSTRSPIEWQSPARGVGWLRRGTRRFVLCATFTATAVLAAEPAPSAPEASLDTLLRAGQDAPSTNIPPLREGLLRDAAFESGVRYGRAARGEEWKKVFETHAIEFERIYRFGELTQPGGEMPPVLEVTRSPNGSRMATKIEDKKMLLSAESIHILTPSRFVATPPSWRNYVYQGLLIQVTPNDLPDRALRPKNAAEQKIWEDAVREGWEAGRKLANQTVAANLARLDRDYFGQLAYVEVLARGMIEPARVGTDRAVVVGNRAGMSIDQTTVNLESDAGLVPDARRWNKQ